MIQFTKSLERQHLDRVPSVNATLRILPVAGLYGPNASGKSNLFKALEFLKALVVEGTMPDQIIARQWFKLDPTCATKPTLFEIDFLSDDDQIFRYHIEVLDLEVVREELRIVDKWSDKVIFSRTPDKVFRWHGSSDSATRKKILRFVADTTRPNQLFLHEARDRNLHELAGAYNWFANQLEILGPRSVPLFIETIVASATDFREYLSQSLQRVDFGINTIETDEKPIEEIKAIPDAQKMELKATLRQNQIALFNNRTDPTGRFLIRWSEGQLKALSLRTARRSSDGNQVYFSQKEESDGTTRFIKLAPALYELTEPSSRRVFAVDELDCSLHPNVTFEMLKHFLSSCKAGSRSQLIFSAHDVGLMTQELFRRDELWLFEKDVDGSTKLSSMGDFHGIRYDTELQKNYLLGRFGGIPEIRHLKQNKSRPPE